MEVFFFCHTIINLLEQANKCNLTVLCPISVFVGLQDRDSHRGILPAEWKGKFPSSQAVLSFFSLCLYPHLFPGTLHAASKFQIRIPYMGPILLHGRAGGCYNFVSWTSAFFATEQHFPKVMLGEEFLSLSLDQVCSLISSDTLTVSSEEKVWSSTFVK